MNQGIQMLNAAWNQLRYSNYIPVCKPVRILPSDHRTLTKRLPRNWQKTVKKLSRLLQHSYQETIAKMIEYFSLILQCTTAIILETTTYYLYSLIKMAGASINGLITEVPYNPPKSDIKRQKVIECVLTRNSKQYLAKAYTKEQVNKLNAEEVDKLFSIYEAKLSGQMVKYLGKLIIKMYSMGACAILGMRNQDVLSEDLESDPFLNPALQRFTCELYKRFGSFLASLSVGLITRRHYLAERGAETGGTNGDYRSDE